MFRFCKIMDLVEWDNVVISGYTIFTGLCRLMGDQTDPRILGHHSLVSEHRYAIT